MWFCQKSVSDIHCEQGYPSSRSAWPLTKVNWKDLASASQTMPSMLSVNFSERSIAAPIVFEANHCRPAIRLRTNPSPIERSIGE